MARRADSHEVRRDLRVVEEGTSRNRHAENVIVQGMAHLAMVACEQEADMSQDTEQQHVGTPDSFVDAIPFMVLNEKTEGGFFRCDLKGF